MCVMGMAGRGWGKHGTEGPQSKRCSWGAGFSHVLSFGQAFPFRRQVGRGTDPGTDGLVLNPDATAC